MAPRVSVILPTYNRLEYLVPAVESVFAQTFADWELIVADDGSNEETHAYLENLGGRPRVRVLWLPHSGNPGAVRNMGIRAAQADYVAFLDSDDVWAASKLHRQIDSLQTRNRCRWGYTALSELGASGHLLSDGRAIPQPAPGRPLLERLLLLQAAIATPSVIAERALLAETGGFDETQVYYEDYDLWIRLALRSEADLIAEPQVFVRRHAQHYYSEGAGALEARVQLFEKCHRQIDAPDLRAIIRKKQTLSAVTLARVHAATTEPVALVRVLASSWLYSWRSPSWYLGALLSVVRILIPAWLADIVRNHRRLALRR
jgi:glycosyltransferase involved in cell wall biosynthesis